MAHRDIVVIGASLGGVEALPAAQTDDAGYDRQAREMQQLTTRLRELAHNPLFDRSRRNEGAT
jgi:hypothetical protein